MNKIMSLDDYVQQALALQNMAVDEQRLVLITEQFALLQAMMNNLQAEILPVEIEPAALYFL